eukprot:Skav204380  [mRNA]  locus=scaffold4897:169270:170341:- [translate_table: standard]
MPPILNEEVADETSTLGFQELDTIGMERKLGELTPTEEFVAMLRVLVCANNFLAKVELEDPGRGGEVKLEALDVGRLRNLS